jgi:hypothetical protein
MLMTGAPPSYTEYVAIVAWSGRRCREENLKIREVSPLPAVPPPRGSRATELLSVLAGPHHRSRGGTAFAARRSRRRCYRASCYFLFLMSFSITGWFA